MSKSIHDAVLKARGEGFEARLHRQAIRDAEIPHIARRLLQDHLGRQWYVNRIEMTYMGVQFYLKGSETKGKATDLNNLVARVHKHMRNGGVINLDHWAEIVFTY